MHEKKIKVIKPKKSLSYSLSLLTSILKNLRYFDFYGTFHTKIIFHCIIFKCLREKDDTTLNKTSGTGQNF